MTTTDAVTAAQDLVEQKQQELLYAIEGRLHEDEIQGLRHELRDARTQARIARQIAADAANREAEDAARRGSPLVLLVHLCAERRTSRVTFEAGADTLAALFIAAHGSVCTIAQDYDAAPVADSEWTATLAALNPECEHGLSLQLCSGPNHYPADR